MIGSSTVLRVTFGLVETIVVLHLAATARECVPQLYILSNSTTLQVRGCNFDFDCDLQLFA